jgi:hypothetical protein
MSYLREEFATARREYAAFRYPGDLSRELLAPRVRWRGIVVFGAMGAGAIAAAAVVAALLLRPVLAPADSQPRPYLPLGKDMHLPQDLQFKFPSLPSIPGVPDNLSLRSVAPDLGLPSEWRLPFRDESPPSPVSDSSEHA